MIRTHEQRQPLGKTYNDGKSLADQSQANDTNINVILKKYGVTGVATGRAGAPQYLDHTAMPRDLREAYDQVRGANRLRESLPEPLRGKTLDELNELTMEQLNSILHPPAPTPEQPKDEPK